MNRIIKSMAALAVAVAFSAPAVATVTAVPDVPPGGPWPFTASAGNLTVSVGGLPGVVCEAEVEGVVHSNHQITDIVITVSPGDSACSGVTVSTGDGSFDKSGGVIHIQDVVIATTLGDCGNPSTLTLGWDNTNSAFVFDGATLPYVPVPPLECEFSGDDFPTDPTFIVTP